MIRHYYHLWADGQWQEPLSEHLTALAEASFPAEARIGLTGTAASRTQVLEWLTRESPHPWSLTAEAEQAWEGLTLDRLWHDAAALEPAAVLYAHTKGSFGVTAQNRDWRRSMTRHLITGWQECMPLLADSDLTGCHWLTPADVFRGGLIRIIAPHFGGNFWWARSQYLARLPAPPQDRLGAELWVGSGNPRVTDLFPGRPADVYAVS